MHQQATNHMGEVSVRADPQEATNHMGEVSVRADPQVSNPCALPCAWNVDPKD